MDIQSRKIMFVQEFLKIQSEKTISQLEKLLIKETKAEMEPMTLKQYRERIEQSIEDSQNGNVIDADDLLSEIEKWG